MQADRQTDRKVGLGTGRGCRLEKDRNVQIGRQEVRYSDRQKGGVGNSHGMQVGKRQKRTDRQARGQILRQKDVCLFVWC